MSPNRYTSRCEVCGSLSEAQSIAVFFALLLTGLGLGFLAGRR